METKIMQGDKTVGTYDHEANEMASEDPKLTVIPIEGVFAFFGETKDGISKTRQGFVKPEHPEFFFAFVDTIERMGYRVDRATEQEYVRRRRKQCG